ncbi:response regulator [Lapillicoccus sp.]|uniref:response regulator transcription factor n=1 Tax=Lapillicoccus sp. TaxID=1909287 RepID=UPI0025EC43DD|nr:response regulator [Lapillicoccus sp.]
MITVGVVDDDYHVAHAHRLSVERVAGFTVVGEAHTGAEAVALVDASAPDLLLLDVYLPDFDGLEVVRRLMASSDHLPDFLLVTAARDIDSVRTAMQLGAFHYLVKPFTFITLREQLETYRSWAERLGHEEEANQQVVDDLFSLRAKQPRPRVPTRPLQPTMAKVLDIVSKAPEPVGAAEVASVLGASRPTAQRYLAALLRKDLVRLDLSYGATGRPEHRYRV